jgi:hypothetical protein
MLYANMMPLLAQVYSGRIDTKEEQTNLGEDNEKQANVRVLPGGIRIAGIY